MGLCCFLFVLISNFQAPGKSAHNLCHCSGWEEYIGIAANSLCITTVMCSRSCDKRPYQVSVSLPFSYAANRLSSSGAFPKKDDFTSKLGFPFKKTLRANG